MFLKILINCQTLQKFEVVAFRSFVLNVFSIRFLVNRFQSVLLCIIEKATHREKMMGTVNSALEAGNLP